MLAGTTSVNFSLDISSSSVAKGIVSWRTGADSLSGELNWNSGISGISLWMDFITGKES